LKKDKCGVSEGEIERAVDEPDGIVVAYG